MSLIAWYKLDGNALDSSGNGNHGTATNVSWVDGKIAQCGDFSSTGYVSTSKNLLAIPSFSISCFFRWGGDTSYNFLISNYTTSSDSSRFYLSVYNSRLSMRIGGSLVYFNFYPQANTWHHVTLTYDGGEYRAYAESNYVGNHISTIFPTSASDTTISSPIGSYNFSGYIDDVRIYDHALSEKEIKELAKAKILHYTFDEFQEPTENIQVSPEFENNWGSWDTGAISYETMNVLGKVTRVATLSEKIAGGGNAIYQSTPNYIAGEDYTLSTYVRIKPSAITDTASIKIYMNSYDTKTVTKNWTRIDTTQTASSAVQATHITQVTICDFEIAFVQIEQKDHATPFVNGVRTGSITDSSGYNNHADLALATTPQWDSNTVLGIGAYTFSGDDKYIESSLYATGNQEVSFSLWVKRGASNGAYQIPLAWGEQAAAKEFGFSINSSGYGSVDNWQFSKSPFDFFMTQDLWYHIVGIWDGTKISQYVNGIKSSSDWTVSLNITSDTLRIGKGPTGAYTFNGSVADIKFYSTALSADDVKELYNTRAQLDNRGNLFLSQINQPAIVPDGLVGWWPLAGDTKDYSGYANDGVNNGAVSTTGVTGEADTAYSFDGVNDYIDCGDNEPIKSITNTITVSLWARYNSYVGSGGSNSYSVLVIKGRPWTFVMENPSNKIRFRITVGGSDLNAPDTVSHELNRWYFFTGIYDGTSIKIYKDAVLVGSTSATGAIGTSSSTMKIGTYTGSTYNFDGLIQDVRIYNRALSEGEIGLLYKEGLNLL